MTHFESMQRHKNIVRQNTERMLAYFQFYSNVPLELADDMIHQSARWIKTKNGEPIPEQVIQKYSEMFKGNKHYTRNSGPEGLIVPITTTQIYFYVLPHIQNDKGFQQHLKKDADDKGEPDGQRTVGKHTAKMSVGKSTLHR